MNKSELIKAVAAKVALPQAKVAEVLDAAVDAAAEAVKKGEGLQIIGVASIAIKQQAARKAKNPRTGAVINVPARKVVRIKPGSKFAL